MSTCCSCLLLSVVPFSTAQSIMALPYPFVTCQTDQQTAGLSLCIGRVTTLEQLYIATRRCKQGSSCFIQQLQDRHVSLYEMVIACSKQCYVAVSVPAVL